MIAEGRSLRVMAPVRASEIGQTFQAPRAIEKIAENRNAPADSSGPAPLQRDPRWQVWLE
jgi:hypothetical protein